MRIDIKCHREEEVIMTTHCAVCGFAADRRRALPEAWQAYLGDELETVEREEGGATVWLCLGCGKRMDQLLDPRHPEGGGEVDGPVREFLDEIRAT
jgi:ribosomal protein L37E